MSNKKVQINTSTSDSPVVGADAAANTWKEISIPLSSLGSPSQIKLIRIGDRNYDVAVTANLSSWKYLDITRNGWGGFTYGSYSPDGQLVFAAKSEYWNGPRKLVITRNAGADVEFTGIDVGGSYTAYGDPHDAKILFIGNLRSGDGGLSWNQMVNCDGVFTHNPTGAQELYGSKGETIVKSVDRGATWTNVKTLPNWVDDLAYDHVNNMLYAASGGNGLFVYNVAAGTTKNIIDNTPASQFGLKRIVTVAVDPVKTNIIYIGSHADIYATDAAVSRSIDGGDTWEVLTRSPRHNNAKFGIDGGREAQCIRVHPVTREAYVATNCYGIWKIGPPSSSDVINPTAPANLVSTAKTAGSVSLTWTASTDNEGVVGYNIYRGTVLVGSSVTTSYTASGLTPSAAYSFTVKAKDANGNISSASNTLSITTGTANTTAFKIMPLGNSLTHGEGGSPSYRGPLRKMLIESGYVNVDFVGPKSGDYSPGDLEPRDGDHAGFAGWTVGPSAQNFSIYQSIDWIMSYPTDVVLLEIGVNDLFASAAGGGNYHGDNYQQTLPDRYEELVKKILQIQPNVKIMVATLCPVKWDVNWSNGGDAYNLNQRIKTLPAKYPGKVYFVDMFEKLKASIDPNADYRDDIHFTQAGATKMAQAWFGDLNTLLGGNPPALELKEAETVANAVNGINYSYYEGAWNNLPNFSTLASLKTGTVSGFSLTPRTVNDNFGFKFTGFISVPTDGEYTFYNKSDDGSKVFIGATEVINNDGLHGSDSEVSGKIGLKAGKHTITVTFFELGGGELLELSYAGPGISKTSIPASALFIPAVTVVGTVNLRTPENPSDVVRGVEFKYYEGANWTQLPDFNRLAPVKTGTVSGFSLTPRTVNDNFGFKFTGFINVPTDGEYTFYTTSDDGSQMFIGSTLVVRNDSLHASRERSGKIGLKAGKHAFTVLFFEKGGNEVLTVSYAGPGIAKTTISGSALYKESPDGQGVVTARTANGISVDGSLSEVAWNLNKVASKAIEGASDNTVTFGALWNSNYLYIGAKVLDANVFNDSPNAWEEDGIEIYIDADNNGGTTYDAKDRQYIKFNNSVLFANGDATGVLHAYSAIAGGYSVEVAIPWTNLGLTPTAGLTIGFDLGNNDDDNGGARESQLVWFGTANNWMNTSGFGDLKLSASAARTGMFNQAGLSVFPNPAKAEVTVATEAEIVVKVSLINNLGIVSLEKDGLNSQEIKINLDLLQTGVYALKVETAEGNVLTKRLVIE